MGRGNCFLLTSFFVYSTSIHAFVVVQQLVLSCKYTCINYFIRIYFYDT